MVKPAKNTICLWYDGDAEDAARFYAETFPDSSVSAVHRADGRVGESLGVKARRVLGVPVVPKADRVLCWLFHVISPSGCATCVNVPQTPYDSAAASPEHLSQ